VVDVDEKARASIFAIAQMSDAFLKAVRADCNQKDDEVRAVNP
jgi:hypothetical protein